MNDPGLRRGKLRAPLVRRLAVTIILVSAAITLCLTAFQLYDDYRGNPEELLDRAFTVLASNALNTFVVAGFALGFFYWLVNRHLLAIAAYLRGLDLHGRASSLKLARGAGRRPDELDELVGAINFLYQNVRSTFAMLDESESRRKQAEEILRLSHKRLRDILDNLFVFVGILSTDGILIEANQAPLQASGLRREDVIGKPFADIYSWNYSPQVRERLQSALTRAASGEIVRYDEVILMANDQRVSMDVMFGPLRDAEGHIYQIVATATDITERRQVEGALREHADRLRQLTRRLMELEEQQRRQLARELHDRVGANLSALNMNLRMVATALSPESARAAGAQLADCEALLTDTVRQVRDVMADLRPAALDELGLFAALDHHVRLIANRANLAFEISGSEGVLRLLPNVEIALFRIAQEALNNITKHARASHINLTLRPVRGRVILAIMDDGLGFDTSTRRAEAGGLGVTTMRERAEAIGARFAVESSPGKGTRITIDAPCLPL